MGATKRAPPLIRADTAEHGAGASLGETGFQVVSCFSLRREDPK